MNLELCDECGAVLRKRGNCPNCGRIAEDRPLRAWHPPNEEAEERARSIGPVWGGADPVEAGYTQVGPATAPPKRQGRRRS